MVAAVGTGGVEWSGILESVLIPGVFAVLIAGSVAVIGTKVAYGFLRRIGDDMATRGYRLGQIGSASLVSLGHGTNDAQKTMGIIVLALDRERQSLRRQLHGPAVGEGQLRDRDRAGDLHGRLADHRHARQEGHR